MSLSRWGFDKKIKNVDKLDQIYDLIEGKCTIEKLGFWNYVVYEDDAIIKEIEELQKGLTKKWYSYVNHSKEFKRVKKVMSKTEYLKEKKLFEEREKIEKNKEKESLDKGIYGIYYDNKLIYIGKTNVSFKTRFKQHEEAIKNKSTTQYLYKYINQLKEKEIIMKPLVNVKELKVKGKINNRDIEAMELALIDLYKPICNIQGIKQDYEFS